MGEDIHRLGMAMSIAGAVWSAAWAATAIRRRSARHSRELLLGVARRRRPSRMALWRAAIGHSTVRDWCAVAAAGLAAAVVVGGLAGAPAGLAAAYAARWWRRRPRPRPDPPGMGQLPAAAELLAACLAAGAAPSGAADAVGRALGGPWGEALAGTAAELRLGGDPAECWGRFGNLPGARPLGRWMELASTSGVPPVAGISRLAADYRAERSRAATGRARRAAVMATAPLGLCFLPAFLAVGLVPVLIGLAEGITRAG